MPTEPEIIKNKYGIITDTIFDSVIRNLGEIPIVIKGYQINLDCDSFEEFPLENPIIINPRQQAFIKKEFSGLERKNCTEFLSINLIHGIGTEFYRNDN